MINPRNNRSKKGAIMIIVFIFGTTLILMFLGLLDFILLQHRRSIEKVSWNEAIEIAEAGINYSRWHLYHSPSDFSFSKTYDYKNPEGIIIGQYQLVVAPPSTCDIRTKITATGWTLKYPQIRRTIQVSYAKPALARYGFLTNSNVWFGENEEVKGPFHSNGGIRMDGEQNSLATSARLTYTCGGEHGCNPSATKPGIWGVGGGEEKGLWQFPASNFDFGRIIQDLSAIKQASQSSGLYLEPSGKKYSGYHLKFKSNGTVDVYKVKGLMPVVWGYDGVGWLNESNDISTEQFVSNFVLSLTCGPIFVEDDIWIEGDVKGRTTVAAGRFPDLQSTNAKAIISGNINYVDANSALGIIAQKDILIPFYSPNNLEIKAALLAQKGHIFRYYYPPWTYEPYRTYAIRNYIETYGSIITNTMWTFTWVDSGGSVVSGYRTTEMSYNPDFTYYPPPYYPVSGDYEISEWKEL